MPSLWMIKAKANILFQEKSAELKKRFRRDSWEGHKGFELSPTREEFEERRGIKWLPLLPAVFALVALTLAFLCVLAGSRPGYMDDYAILTVSPNRQMMRVILTKANSSIPPPSASTLFNLQYPAIPLPKQHPFPPSSILSSACPKPSSTNSPPSSPTGPDWKISTPST